MSTLEAEPISADPLETAILEASLAIIMRKAIEFGFTGCDAERNAIASFANFAATKALAMHRLTPCPEHKPEAVVVRGLVFALARSILEVAKLDGVYHVNANRIFHAAVAELKQLVEANAAAKQQTHDVAGGVQ